MDIHDLTLKELRELRAQVQGVNVQASAGFARLEERIGSLGERLTAHEISDLTVMQRVDDLERHRDQDIARDRALERTQKTAKAAKTSAIGGAAAAIVAILYTAIDMVAKYWPGHGAM